MGINDLVLTPIYLFIIYLMAYAVRHKVTNHDTVQYFIPALTAKIMGAISVGLIYQFYYDGGGDTFGYWEHGSNHIYNAFLSNPLVGVKMLLSNGIHYGDIFEFSSRIWYFRDPASYFIVKIAGVFDLFSFKTYSVTAIFFAIFSFTGLWAMYNTFYRIYPTQKKLLAYAVLFVPSAIFWGSGILKDSITLGALGWITFAVFNIFYSRRKVVLNIIILFIFSWVLFSIKKYILISFLAAATFWLYSIYIIKIKSAVVRSFLAPFLIVIVMGLGYFLTQAITSSDSKYAFDQIAKTAQVTAYDIRYGWGKDGGSGYTLGALDGSFGSMLALSPSAIGTTLFRPFIWEAGNPLMLMAALEATIFLCISLYFVVKNPRASYKKFSDPHLRFVLTFAFIFAFAVGVSTYNFGSLSRYKIPMLPFYGIGLVIINNKDGRLA